MKFRQAPLSGILIIEPNVLRDDRGFFMELYHKKKFEEHGIHEEFVQDNVSRSPKGTLRGLHYQLQPFAQGKLVSVTEGTVFDVNIDIRRGSPTFGKWFSYTLTGENRHVLYVPPGFAHGFCVLSDEAEFNYKCTSFYNQKAERVIAWNDPKLGIPWPLRPNPRQISEKDRNARGLDEAEINFGYEPMENHA